MRNDETVDYYLKISLLHAENLNQESYFGLWNTVDLHSIVD
jgi:hypothetical protein